MTFTVSEGGLRLTVDADALVVCPDCPDLHVQVIPNATPRNLRLLAAGIHALADLIELGVRDVEVRPR